MSLDMGLYSEHDVHGWPSLHAVADKVYTAFSKSVGSDTVVYSDI